MKTITFNPENWKDQEAKARIDGNIVYINDEKLELVQQPIIFSEINNAKYDYHSYAVMWEGQKLCTISRFGADFDDDRGPWETCDAAVYRQHDNPHVLAAIMACNLI